MQILRENAEKITSILISFLNEKIEPIVKFINEKMDMIDINKLKIFIEDKISIDSEKIKEIIDKQNSIKNEFININENISNKIIAKIDELIDYIYDLDEEINEKSTRILDKIFEPFEVIINELKNISNKIIDKIYEIKNELMRKLDEEEEKMKKMVENIIDKAEEKLENFIPDKVNINSISLKGNVIDNKSKDQLKKLVKIPSNLIKKLQSLQEGMRKYEESSKMDETINILNDTILDELIRLLIEAFKNSKVGDFIMKGAQELLKEIENTKNNLRGELQDIGVI